MAHAEFARHHDHRLVGLISYTALLRHLGRGAGDIAPREALAVRDLMRKDVVAVAPDTPVIEALALMRRQADEYHPPVGGAPLDPKRRRRAIAMLFVFCLIATPVPFRPIL